MNNLTKEAFLALEIGKQFSIQFAGEKRNKLCTKLEKSGDYVYFKINDKGVRQFFYVSYIHENGTFDGHAGWNSGQLLQVQTIDCTPTWQSLLPELIEMLDSKNAHTRKVAIEQLLRCAVGADRYIAERKANKEKVCNITNETFAWTLEIGVMKTSLGHGGIADFFEEHFKSLGYTVVRDDDKWKRDRDERLKKSSL